jgi:hypothetical protein
MNHSFYSVDRTTHLKIVTLALIGATAIAAIAISAHVRDAGELAQTAHAGVVKAKTTATIASNTGQAVR